MTNTQDINGLQQQTDVEQAKNKLAEIQEVKEARKDPRAAEKKDIVLRRPATDEKKDIRPVTAKPKKKKFGQKLKEAMFSEDIGNGSVTEHIFFRILIPSVKRVLSDMANTAINMALGLDPKTRTVGAGNTHVANASLYRDRNYNRPASYGSRRTAISEYEWDEATANDIYGQIMDIIEQYGDISISDVYSIMGMGTQVRTTDRNWGWTRADARDICVTPLDAQHERNIIDLPSARALH